MARILFCLSIACSAPASATAKARLLSESRPELRRLDIAATDPTLARARATVITMIVIATAIPSSSPSDGARFAQVLPIQGYFTLGISAPEGRR